MLNNLFLKFGIEGWKPALSALMLPPVPWLLLMRLVQLVVRKSNRQLSMWSVALLKSQPVSVQTAVQYHVLLPTR